MKYPPKYPELARLTTYELAVEKRLVELQMAELQARLSYIVKLQNRRKHETPDDQ